MASLTSRLVDLALVASPDVFKEILNLFSTLSHESLTLDNKQLSSSVKNPPPGDKRRSEAERHY